jgi:hypothetical protein
MKKLWAALFMVLLSSNANSTDSKIYIDQLGDALTLSITQQNGALNQLNSSTTPAIINGDNNDITVMQDGAVNTLNFELNGNNNIVDLRQEGNTNTMEFKCNAGNTDACSGVNAKFYNIGDSNTTDITIKKSNVTLDATVTGDSNQTTLLMNSTGGSLTLNITGDSNTTSFTQSGAPLVPHTATIIHTGNSGNFTYSQSGSINKVMSVTTNGNNLTATITQSD